MPVWLKLTFIPIALYVTIFVIPAALSYALSLFEWSGVGPIGQFVGLDNFARVVEDPIVRDAFVHNLVLYGLLFVLTNSVSLAIAMLLNHRTRLRYVYRVVVFLPFILSPIATGFMWQLLLDPTIGLVNPMLERLGAGAFTSAWLADPNTALIALSLAVYWQWNGAASVLFLAGLQNVSVDLSEAARLDGAGRWQLFRNVTWPGIAPSLVVVNVLLVVYTFRLFDLPYVLGGSTGAPGGSTTVLGTRIFATAFGQSALSSSTDMSYAMAQGILLFTFIVALTVVLMVRSDRRSARE